MEAETIALIISVLGNFIVLVIGAYSKMYSNIIYSKNKVNKEIQMLKQCITIFMNSNNYEQAKILCKKTMEDFNNNLNKLENRINEK